MAVNFCHWFGNKDEKAYSPFPEYFRAGMAKGVFEEIERIGKSSDGEVKDPVEAGLNVLKTFCIMYFPNVSKVLTKIAMAGGNNYSVIFSDGRSFVTREGDLEDGGAEIISEFFRGYPINQNNRYYCVGGGFPLEKASQLYPLNTFPEDPQCTDEGLTADEKQLSYALKAISDLYYNLNDLDKNLLQYRGVIAIMM